MHNCEINKMPERIQCHIICSSGNLKARQQTIWKKWKKNIVLYAKIKGIK